MGNWVFFHPSYRGPMSLHLCFTVQRLAAGTKFGSRFTSEGFGAGSHHLQCSRLVMPEDVWERFVVRDGLD